MKVYRISEYSFDVDFLANHDSASVDAMPLYLMTCDPDGNCSPWDAHIQSPKWDRSDTKDGVIRVRGSSVREVV